jgi:hypothetical protein
VGNATAILLSALLVVVLADSARSLAPRALELPTTTRYDPYLDDYVVFHAAGRLAVHEPQRLYDPESIRRETAATVGRHPSEVATLPFYHPPYVAIALVPIGAMPAVAGAATWTALSCLVMVALFAWLLWWPADRMVGPPPVVLLAIVASMPFYQTVVHGQMTGVLVLGVVALWIGMFRGRSDGWLVAGIVLLSIKPPLLVVPLALAVVQRRWRPLAWAGTSGAVLLAASAATLGPGVIGDYLRLSFAALGWDEVNGISTYGMFGWNALLRSVIGPEATVARAVITVLLTMATICATAWGVSRLLLARAPVLAFGLTISAMILASPHLCAHDLLILAVPIALALRDPRPAARHLAVLVAIAALLVTYFHLDLLERLGVNVTTLAIGAFFAATVAAAGPRLQLAARRDAQLVTS